MLKGERSARCLWFLERKIKPKEGELFKFKLKKANLWLMKRACSENKQIQSRDKQLTNTETSEHRETKAQRRLQKIK